jgi:cytidylate kinase
MIYRAMAWLLIENGWNPGAPLPADALQAFSMRIDGDGGLWVNDGKVLADLGSEEISAAASIISSDPKIRDRSNDVQRRIVRRIEEDASFPGVILEGRDIGTVVFPDATHKFFLTASEAVRAARRFKEKQGENPGLRLEAVQAGLRERDQRDETREVAPLRAADDAIQVDTSELSMKEVVETLLEAVLATGSQK